MKISRTTWISLALMVLAAVCQYASARPLALIHDRTADHTGLAWVEADGSLTSFGDSYSGCCRFAGALATLADDQVVFVGQNPATGNQSVHVLTRSGLDTPPAPVSISGGTVIALAWDESTAEVRALIMNGGTLSLGTLDIDTGVVAAVGDSLADCCATARGIEAFDPVGRHWYFLGFDAGAGSWHLYTLNADSGALESTSAALTTPPSQLAFDEQLYAYYANANGGRLALIDPISGLLTDRGNTVAAARLTAPGVAAVTDDALLLVARSSANAVPALHLSALQDGSPQALASVPPTLVVNALFEVPTDPRIAQGSSTMLTTTEDAGAVSLNLDATDPSNTGLTWEIAANGTLGVASVGTGSGLSQQIDYLPAPDAFGSDGFSVRVSDGNGGEDRIDVMVEIAAVNDAPNLIVAPTLQGIEDTAATNLVAIVSASPGPANEGNQTLSYTVTANDNPALFSVQPSIDANGELSYTPAVDANGSALISIAAMDDGGTGNGGSDTSAAHVTTLEILAVNDAPSFSGGPNLVVLEDSGPQLFASWAIAISAGPTDESVQNLSFQVSTNNDSLFATLPEVDPVSGDLTYQTAPDAFGNVTVSVALMDNGGIANGGDNTSTDQTFTIEVVSVNDAPQLDIQGDLTVEDTAGPRMITNYASNLAPGPANESGQAVSLTLTGNSNPAIFAEQPAIDPFGTLTFSPLADSAGAALIELTLSDDGGTGNQGEDTTTRTFRIIVEPSARADLGVEMTADLFSLQELGQITYTIVLTNHGPLDVQGGLLIDPLPLELTDATWTCVASAGESCAATSGNGDIEEPVDVGLNGTLTYHLTATADTVEGMVIINFAEVLPPETPADINPANDYAVVETRVGLFSDSLEELGMTR